MQFLPCKRERYISALRIHMQKNLIKGTEIEKFLPTLRKLKIEQLMLGSPIYSPTDIAEFSRSLSGAALVTLIKKGYFVSTVIKGCSNGLLNRNFFSAALLLLTADAAKAGSRVIIDIKDGGTTLCAQGLAAPSRELRMLAQKNAAPLLYEKKRGITAISINTEKADGPPQYIPEDTELVCDPLSDVKVFLSNLPSRYR